MLEVGEIESWAVTNFLSASPSLDPWLSRSACLPGMLRVLGFEAPPSRESPLLDESPMILKSRLCDLWRHTFSVTHGSLLSLCLGLSRQGRVIPTHQQRKVYQTNRQYGRDEDDSTGPSDFIVGEPSLTPSLRHWKAAGRAELKYHSHAVQWAINLSDMVARL